MMTKYEVFGYEPDEKYSKSIAYFSMEFAVHYALQIYSGGLGFLAGSHIRSAFELKQNFIGIGILWKYGYYDQERNEDQTMKASFIEKNYSFLTDTGIVFSVVVNNSDVKVKVYLLKPEVFGSAPLFLLSTDIEDNDPVSRTITQRLYDSNESTRIAQSIILGIGGAKLIDELGWDIDTYHMNEGHGLALCFYLYAKFGKLEDVKKRVVFTTHTPEEAGNEKHSVTLLNEMSFFYKNNLDEIKSLLKIEGDILDYTLSALRFSRIANGVSKLHGQVANDIWRNKESIPPIISITNAQNKSYWMDKIIEEAVVKNDDFSIIGRKKDLKRELFKMVAIQCGKIFDENILTIVWSRRFAGYKRANLLMFDYERFKKLVDNTVYPVQIIWAGKPYPEDFNSISIFNDLIKNTCKFKNCAVLTGYELNLSSLLKKGSDVWLNTPRMYREASGTSGMTAAMNASVNVSIPDGWVPEFAKDRQNCFIISPADRNTSIEYQDKTEYEELMEILEQEILPLYYNDQQQWLKIVKEAIADVIPGFESGRMAVEYYEKLYKI